MVQKLRRSLLCLAILGIASGSVCAQNILLNPGLEPGKKSLKSHADWRKIPGWSGHGAAQILAPGTPEFPARAYSQRYLPEFSETILPHSGKSYAFLAPQTGIIGLISETAIQEPGTEYILQLHIGHHQESVSPQDFTIEMMTTGSENTYFTPEIIQSQADAQLPHYPWQRLQYSIKWPEKVQAIRIIYTPKTANTPVYLDDIWLEPSATCRPYASQMGRNFLPEGWLNVLENSSFEDKSRCPENREDLPLVRHWTPGKNTPDYFHICAQGTPAGIHNELGIQVPHSGKAYAGFWASTGGHPGMEEYLRIKFSKNLQGRTPHQLRAWVSLAEISDRALTQLEVQFHMSTSRKILTYPLVPTGNESMQDKDRWVEIGADFVALGDEYLMIIGNFHSPQESPTVAVSDMRTKDLVPILRNSVYYYIDDVTLSRPLNLPGEDSVPTPDIAEVDTLPNPNFEIETGKEIVIKAVYFDLGSANLRTESYASLEKVKAILLENPTCKMEIQGHTDDIGTDADNLILSQNRANAVRRYLIDKGIASERLTAKGFGESRPLKMGISAADRQENRRVSYVLFP